MKVNRFDRFTIPSSKRTQEGFLRIDGSKVARTGVQEYRRADGKVIRELREPETVFDAGSMSSLALLPLTNNHPAKMLDVNDAKQHAVGAVGEAKKLDDKWLTAPISVWDKDAIASIEAGRTQLSAGYSCEIVDEAGEWNGQHYDCKQRGVTFNHLALVDTARAGPEARLRLDAGDAESVESHLDTQRRIFAGDNNNPVSLTQENKRMSVLKVDGFTLKVEDDNAQAIVDKALAAVRKDGDDRVLAEMEKTETAEKAKADLQKAHDEVKGKHDALTEKLKADAEKMMKCDECGGSGKHDGAECKGCAGKGEFAAKADTAEARLDMIERMADRRASQKAALYTVAARILGANEKLDGKTDLEIMKLVVLKDNPQAKLDGQSIDYVRARFDSVIDRAPKPVDVAVVQATQVGKQKADQAPATDPDTARRNMLARYQTSNGKQAE